jgi:hypothetical protein
MENWKDITLGELATNTKIGVRRARRFLKAHSPVWMNVELNGEALKHLWETFNGAIAAPILYFLQGTGDRRLLAPAEVQPLEEPTVTVSSEVSKKKPHWKRTEAVFRVLSEAWEFGAKTYTQLMAAVKEATGKGCSKRAIANWKRERGLIG